MSVYPLPEGGIYVGLPLKGLTQNRLLLNTCMDANMQLTINNFRQRFPSEIISLTFP